MGNSWQHTDEQCVRQEEEEEGGSDRWGPPLPQLFLFLMFSFMYTTFKM